MADPRLDRPLWRGRTNVDAYTIAWIEHAEQVVRDEHPAIAHAFVVTQGSYQGDGGDPDSGTTHRLGGAVDMRWCGHQECLLALRQAGGFVWRRFPWQGDWPDHFHGAPIGHPFMDYRLAAQEDSYLAGGNGLGGPDDAPRPNPIPRPVWPWPPEDPMADYAKQLDRIERKIDRNQETFAAFRKNVLPRVKELEQSLGDLEAVAKDTASKQQLAKMRAVVNEMATVLRAATEDES